MYVQLHPIEHLCASISPGIAKVFAVNDKYRRCVDARRWTPGSGETGQFRVPVQEGFSWCFSGRSRQAVSAVTRWDSRSQAITPLNITDWRPGSWVLSVGQAPWKLRAQKASVDNVQAWSLLSGIDCGKYLIKVSFLTDGRCHRRRVIYAVGYFPRPTAGREGQRSYRQRNTRPVFLFSRGISSGRCGFQCGQRRRGW